MKKCLLILVLWLMVCSVANAVVVDPSDSNIQYMGRWDDSNPSEPKIAWQGGAITVNFNGTGIKATIDADDVGNAPEDFKVVIDDDYFNPEKCYTISFPGTPTQKTLASGLTDGVHKLVLMKEYYWDGYDSVFHGFDVTGSGLVTPPARPTLKMECFGDSNAAGDNIGTEDNSDNHGQYFAFPFIAARALGAEMHNLSVSSKTISDIHGQYDRYGWDGSLWDFSRYTPDIVIVELGANDVAIAGSPQATIISDYHAFLDDLRIKYPLAHICLMNGVGWSSDEPANYTADVVADRHDSPYNDSNISYVHHPWVFGEWHGCENEHAGMARFLVEHLENELGITAPNPIDIMDGFGRDGDVANGSFEEISPFGGWGWRFFDDPGVSRVNDAAGAKNGDYYLSLSSGASSYQTNPANSGETYTVTAWMRGTAGGEQVDITIDFRDQDSGGIDEDDNPPAVPIASYTETQTLTTSWVQYSMTATAPVTGNPIFGTRTTFTATSGTVYIDDVVESRLGTSCGDGGECYFSDLVDMASVWLTSDSQWDIAPGAGDGTVDYIDFNILAETWTP